MSQPRRRRLEVEDIGDVTVVNFIDKKILDEQNIQIIGDSCSAWWTSWAAARSCSTSATSSSCPAPPWASSSRSTASSRRPAASWSCATSTTQIYEVFEITKLEQALHHPQGRAGRACRRSESHVTGSESQASESARSRRSSDFRNCADLHAGHARRHASNVVIPSDLAEARRVQDADRDGAASGRLRRARHLRHQAGPRRGPGQRHQARQPDGPRQEGPHRLPRQPDRFDIRITDEGPGFDPERRARPDRPENLERPCGRGLLLMRHYMTEVSYHDRGNSVA